MGDEMKKIYWLILVLICSFSIVKAEDINELYFTEKDNHLYYSTNRFDEKVFMNHTNMIPGKTYTDTLLIKNESSDTDYTLYFQVKERDNTELAKELIDNIDMKIYVDDELIYDGDANGNTYDFNGLSLQKAFKLGEYKKGESHTLVVETTLKYEYDNKDNQDEAYVDWAFYGEYTKVDGSELFPLEPNPNTYDDNMIFACLLVFSCIVIMIVLLVLSHEKKKNE